MHAREEVERGHQQFYNRIPFLFFIFFAPFHLSTFIYSFPLVHLHQESLVILYFFRILPPPVGSRDRTGWSEDETKEIVALFRCLSFVVFSCRRYKRPAYLLVRSQLLRFGWRMLLWIRKARHSFNSSRSLLIFLYFFIASDWTSASTSCFSRPRGAHAARTSLTLSGHMRGCLCPLGGAPATAIGGCGRWVLLQHVQHQIYFTTSRWNNCSIHPKTEHLKILESHCKYMLHPDLLL
jgi:hypothetical protein